MRWPLVSILDEVPEATWVSSAPWTAGPRLCGGVVDAGHLQEGCGYPQLRAHQIVEVEERVLGQ